MEILKEWGPFALVLLTIVLIRTFVATPVRVDGESMYSTLDDGDILLLEKYDTKYERFDIVVFDLNGERLIKRVIGLPGDEVEYKNNTLYINGTEVDEIYGYGITQDFKYTKKVDNCYFVVGDNRNNSLDSRYFGCVPKDKIIGSVRYVLFPFNKFGSIKK